MCTATERFSDALKILFVGTAFMTLALYTEALSTSADTHHFLEWAIAMAHGGRLPAQSIYASRNIGYPLLLWISGYPYTHSLLGIAVIQAVIAAIMPLLIYFAIRPLSAAAGYYTAMASVLSLAPFYNMKYVGHDLAFNFFLVLSACLLVQYIVSRRAVYLYWGGLSFLMTAVTQPMGDLLFPTFLVLAFVFVRGPLRRYVVCLAVSVVLLFGNLYYRHMLFRVPLGHEMPTIAGTQAFYAPYINSHEFGIRLSPDIGPAMRRLIDKVGRAVPGNPRQLRPVLGDRYNGKGEEEFAEKYYYSLTAPQLRSQLFTLSNFEYYVFIVNAANDERLLLAATLDIARRYPGYIVAYTSRNVWKLLTDPGERHASFNVGPIVREGNPFPLDLRGYVDLDRFPAGAPAIRELRFYDHPDDRIRDLSWLARSAHDTLRDWWPTISRWTVNITFLLMLGGFILLTLRYALALLRHPRLSGIKAALDDAFPAPMGFAFIAAGIILLELYTITGMFTEPGIRFWYQVEGLRIIVAGLGAGVFINLLSAVVGRSAPGKRIVDALSAITPEPTANAKVILSVVVAFFAVTSLISWVVYLIRHTG